MIVVHFWRAISNRAGIYPDHAVERINWVREEKIEYRIVKNHKGTFFLVLRKEEDATLFKLTWA